MYCQCMLQQKTVRGSDGSVMKVGQSIAQLTKLIIKAMYDQDCLIKVNQHNVSSYNLRSLAAPRIDLLDTYELTTFQDQAASVFNKLATEIRLCTDYVPYTCFRKKHFFSLYGSYSFVFSLTYICYISRRRATLQRLPIKLFTTYLKVFVITK